MISIAIHLTNICRRLLPILVIVVSLLALPCRAAQWHAYTYTDQYRRVCRMQDRLYLLKGQTLYLADAATWQLQRELCREDGLSSASIFDIACSDEPQRLAVVYDDGLIDVIHPDGTIWTIPDFAEAPQPGTDKALTAIRVQDHLLFVCTAWGFFVVDLQQEVILQSFQFGFSVQCAWAYADYWYYSNASGIYSCRRTANPFAPGAWQQLSSRIIHQALVFTQAGAQQCWLLTNDHNLRRINASELSSTRCTSSGKFTTLCRAGDYVLAVGSDSLVIYDSRLGMPPILGSPHAEGQRLVCPVRGRYVSTVDACPLSTDGTRLALLHPTLGLQADSLDIQLPATVHLVALQDQDLLIDNHQQSPLINQLHVGAPTSDGTTEIGMTYVPPLITGYKAMLSVNGFLTTYQPDADQWTNLDATVVANARSDKQRFVAVDYMTADPNHPQRYWYGTLEDGIFCLDHGALVEHINNQNSLLANCASSCTRISGIALSPEGDLWCVDEGVTNLLYARQASDQKWYRFLLPGLEKTYGYTHFLHTRHDGRHQLWGYQHMTYQVTNLFVYDYGTSMASTTDDRCTSFKSLTPVTDTSSDASPRNGQEESQFTPYYGRGLFEGPDGAIWVLNTSGLYVIDQPDSVFAHPGEVRAVMTDVVPTSMASDQQNHLWVGTEASGIYLLTTDGRQQLAHFTNSNTLLSTDEVLALAYDSLHSTLWIATSGQLLSYQYDPADYGICQTSVTTAYCHPATVQAGSLSVVNVFGIQEGSTVSLQNSQGRVLSTDAALGEMATFATSTLPVGTYTFTGTDRQGQRGALATFEVTE